MASKLSSALFFSLISLLVLNVIADQEHGPQHLQEYSEVLNRLKAFSGLLYSKFVGVNVDKISTPEAIIKPRAFHAADYQFIRMMALHAKYQFNDDKLPFDQWLKRIQKKDNSKVNEEDQSALHLRKQNNAKTAYDFVVIMCALIRDTLIYDKKFDDYMKIFEWMEIAKKSIEENAAELAKVGKQKWQDFNVEKMSLNRLSGQSIWGLLAMKENVLTEEFMNSKPYLANDNTENFSVVFDRKYRISGFLVGYMKQSLLKKDPVDFLRSAAGRMGNDPVLSTINLHLAKALGFTSWQDEFIAQGRSSPELVYKGMGKVIRMLTALYLMVWEAPFNMQMQSMKDYYPVYERLRKVEEHYRASNPMGWERKVEEAKLMLRNEFAKQNAEEENSNGMKVTAYGRGGSNWSWVWASDNFIENSLARTKKEMPSSSHP